MIILESKKKKNGIRHRPSRAQKLWRPLYIKGYKLILIILLFLLVLGGSPAPLLADSAGDRAGLSAPVFGEDGTLPFIDSCFPADAASDTMLVNPEQKAQVEKMLTHLPLCFIQNQGQLDEQVLFYTLGQNQSIYFTAQGLTFTFSWNRDPADNNNQFDVASDIKSNQASNNPQRWAVKLDFIKANPFVQARGEALTPTQISYFKGHSEDWKTGLHSYSRIVYPNLWPGIDLVFKDDAGSLKYEFVVSPGADPSQIGMSWQGASKVGINQHGQMEIKTPLGGFSDQTPVAWQEVDGQRTTVAVSYLLNESQQDNAQWSFNLGSYDSSRELIIDPAILDYCGYIGGAGDEEWGNDITVDSSGRAYVTGYTNSTEASFPVNGGPDIGYNGGNFDVFVARVAADGASLEYCGYIGGSGSDTGNGIVVDNNGKAYVTGKTSSSNFPVSGGLDNSYNGGNFDTFVARLAADGTSLDYCGYIGGSGQDFGNAIAIDSSGKAYVTGNTASTDFPVCGAPFDTSYNESGDVFVARVAANGDSLDYCGYIGGSGYEVGTDIAVDSSGRAYLTGFTGSANFPVSGGADATHNGGYDVFVARVAANGASLDYSGYIGGSGQDIGNSIAVDSSGRAYLTGYTASTQATFPVSGGLDATHNGGNDVFVARVAAADGSLDYCSYIGGSGDDEAYGIAVDSSGRVYLTGYTDSTQTDFPVSGGPDITHNGGGDAFVAQVAADGASLDYCGYIGGSDDEYGNGIAVDSNGMVYISGYTASTQDQGFPVKGGLDTTHNGGGDTFVARVRFQVQSNQNDILTFTLPEQTRAATINSVGHTVYSEVYFGTNLTSLIPAITISDAASIAPSSGVAQNFSAPFIYTVTAENGTAQNWTVNVSVAPDSTQYSVPGAPTNVTATAGNGTAVVSFTTPTENGGSPITGYVVTSNPGNIIATGSGTAITVTGLINGTTYTFTVKAVNAVGNGSDSTASNAVTPYWPSNGESTSSTPAASNSGIIILFNGKNETAATLSTIKVEGQTVTTIILDDQKVEQKLESEGNDATVTIPVNTQADVIVVLLNGQTVKNMESKEAKLEIKTEDVTYILPAAEINIDNVFEQIGQQAELKNIKVSIRIAKPSADTIKIVQDTANKNNYRIVVEPIQFEITCTSGDKTVGVTRFNGYVERIFAIPDGTDPSKITTGVVVNEDGTFSHVPTTIVLINGKYYAKINSLTNSTYAVIGNHKEFKDVDKHWAKEAINDMGSRLIIDGMGNDRFESDLDITRAEFSAIMVRALGLKPGLGKNLFSDVPDDAWYCNSIMTAAEYKIISGYGNGKLGPLDKITREQAMTMIANAMKITGLRTEVNPMEFKTLFASLEINGEPVDWAKNSVAACIKTEVVHKNDGDIKDVKGNITRGEAAVTVRRLLQKSKLIYTYSIKDSQNK